MKAQNNKTENVTDSDCLNLFGLSKTHLNMIMVNLEF